MTTKHDQPDLDMRDPNEINSHIKYRIVAGATHTGDIIVLCSFHHPESRSMVTVIPLRYTIFARFVSHYVLYSSLLMISYEDVFAEPDGVQSMDYIWQAAFNCFNCSKNTCYKILSTLCGVCCACCWGCEFAVLAFQHVWCLTPCLRTFDIVMGYIQKIVGTISTCCIVPFFEACGMVFSNIKVIKVQS